MQRLLETHLSDDPFGRKLAFNEIIRLTSGNSDLQTGYLLRNFQYVPALRLDALDKLSALNRTGSMSETSRSRALGFFTESAPRTGNAQVDQAAHEFVAELTRQRQVEQVLSRLNQQSRQSVSAIREVAALREPRAITPLIQKAISGDEAVQAEAMQALAQFAPTMVNFYAKMLKGSYQANPVMRRRLDDLVNRRGFYSNSPWHQAG